MIYFKHKKIARCLTTSFIQDFYLMQKYEQCLNWKSLIQNIIPKKKYLFTQQTMRFQNLQNSKIYRLYREDEMDRLKSKIQEIKNRKNQHLSSKQGHRLPYISPGYGFSLERKHQIDKENKRLQQKISKAKNTHSNYYFSKLDLKKSASSKNHHTSRIVQTLSNRSVERSLIIPEAKTDRSPFRQLKVLTRRDSEKKRQKTQETCAQPHSFRKQIMRIYNESFSNFKKLPF